MPRAIPTDADLATNDDDGDHVARSSTSFGRRVESALERPVDIAWLVAFRVLLGLTLAVSMERFIAYGWIDELLVGPSFRFRYYGFSWVPVLARTEMDWLFHALVGLGVATAAGLFFRVTAPLLALGLTYVQLVDVSTYLNHYYLAALLAWLLAVSPAARAGSLDAWLRRRFRSKALEQGEGAPHAEHTVASAWLYLLRFQIGLVYVFAGLAKIGPDWLLHAQPLRIWLGASTELPVLGALLVLPGAPLVFSWLGFLFDTTIVFWLSFARTRPFAYAVVLVFHATTRLLFDIGMFPIIMSVAALVFFSPSWPRHFLGFFRRARARGPVVEAAPSGGPSRFRRAAYALGGLYVLVQLALPLRHLAYGGNVLWHEQGMRFSWRVMVRAKGGSVTFWVKRPSDQRAFAVDPSKSLTLFQENEMAGQPDLILQFAHALGDRYRTGTEHVEVRAETHVSLNGRRAAPLVDPNVDLTRIEDGLGPASWILPAPTEAPPHTRPVL